MDSCNQRQTSIRIGSILNPLAGNICCEFVVPNTPYSNPRTTVYPGLQGCQHLGS